MSPFEALGRARKVAKLAALVPYGVDADSVAGAADFFEALVPKDRNRLARAAGVRPPSETTWSELVAALRARRPLEWISPKALGPAGAALPVTSGAVLAHRVERRGLQPDARPQR